MEELNCPYCGIELLSEGDIFTCEECFTEVCDNCAPDGLCLDCG